MNLISISSLCEIGLIVTFDYFPFSLQDPQSGQTIGRAQRRGRLYHLDFLHVPLSSSSNHNFAGIVSSIASLWHRHLDHISESYLKSLFHNGALGQVSFFLLSLCTGCKLAKHLALLFNNNLFQTTSPFQLVHSDIWGPTPIPFRSRYLYYVSLLMISQGLLGCILCVNDMRFLLYIKILLL